MKDLCEMLRDLQQDESDADRKYQALMSQVTDPGWWEMLDMIRQMERMHGQALGHMHQILCPPPSSIEQIPEVTSEGQSKGK